jgi:hypothetical protein
LVELQEIVADCPLSIADGDALREIAGAGDAGAGCDDGAASFVAAGVGVGAFFAQPVPEMIKAIRTVAATASLHKDLLIAVSPSSCFWCTSRFD